MEGWLGWSVHPIGGAVCRGGKHSTLLLLLALQKWQLGFSLFVSFVQNLPGLCILTVIFSPLEFLCVLLPEQTFVQVQALQQRVPGPSRSHRGPRMLTAAPPLRVPSRAGSQAEWRGWETHHEDGAGASACFSDASSIRIP